MRDSAYFQLHALADGVYAAVCREGTGAMCNAGIVDLGDVTLVFDTFLTAAAAAALRQAAEELTGHPVQYVVNSHWHGDHVLGNQQFAGATIFSTHRTRQLIAERGVITDVERHRANLEQHIHQLSQQVQQEIDPLKRRGLEADLADFRQTLGECDTTQVVLPGVTVGDRLVLHGSQRSVELLCYGGGHTESDLFLYLPSDRIAFLGDLAPVGNHPWLGSGDPDSLVTILDRILQLDLQTVVPGHGLLGSPSDVALTRDYVFELKALAAGLLKRGAAEADVATVPVPMLAREWQAAHVFDWNMRFLCGLPA